jgi:GrpB-like predicted nucleotidyltransferase (UPF0157 family)
MVNKLIRNLKLLIDSPKDFLFSCMYSDSEKVYQKKYNPRAKIAAENLITKLKRITPEVYFYLIGSTGLEIDGVGDIDMFATTGDDLKRISTKYQELMGKPSKARRSFIKWNFKHMGFNVEFFLCRPSYKRFQRQIQLYNLLKSNPDYLREYVSLKENISGYSAKEYVRQRMCFFNRILKESGERS